MRPALYLIVCLAFALPWTAQAGKDPPHPQDTGFLNRSITLNGTLYRYDVYLPMNYDAHQSWPMILFLHGSGERGSDGLDETQVGLPNAIRAHPDRWPFVVVMPQVPYNHHHWTDADMMTMALAAFDAEVHEFHGNPDQLYLTGLSLGGYGTWEIAKDYPGRFAAIVPVSAGIFWSYAPSRWKLQNELPAAYTRAIGKTPIWMFHGALDPVVTLKQAEIMYQAFSASGGNVRLWVFEGWHHNAWDKAYGDPRLPAWLLSHRLSQIEGSRASAEKIVIPIHPVPARVDPAIYTAYEGDYDDGEIRQVTILRTGDRLFAKNRTGDLTELLPESNVTFFYPSGGPVRFTFEKDASGHVTAVLYHDDRHEERWTKVISK